MNPEVPEFHTRPSTPVSPIPYHPPAPSKFPVLENQIDPVFNMTSTHTGSGNDMPLPTNSITTHKDDDHDSSSSSTHSFSDPFEEQDEPQTNVPPPTVAPAGGDADDDYAMTFDNDIEEEVKSPQHTNNVVETAKPTSSMPISIPAASNGAAPVSTANTSHDPVVPPTNTHTAPLVEATQAPASAAAPTPTKRYKQSTPPPIYQSIQKGDIDIQQLLDNITANAERNAAPSAVNAGSPTLPSHAGLPARPPIMPNPSMNPAYTPPGYHAGPSYPGPPGTTRASVFPKPLVAAGAPGTHTDQRNGLPPPPAASFSSPISRPLPRANAPHIPNLRAPPQARGHSVESADDGGGINWNPVVQRCYEEFLAQERVHIASGDFDKFPMGSRLFIGNLPTEKVTKKDVFSIFHKYGRIAQISMKQAYGFVQFLETSSCYEALNREQGQELRGRKMHLEISKMSQKNKPNNQNHNHGQQNMQRRSRSLDRTKDNNRGPNDRNPQQNRNYDRYDNPPYQRQQDYRQGPPHGRDDYRRTRSPSPPRSGYRGRDDYSRGGHDYYDGRDRRRSRSRSPVYDNRRQHDRYRQRSPSPRRPPVDEDAALGIPRRAPGEVPDVQILLMEQLDRNFIQWVEAEIKKPGLKTEVMFLSPRLNEDAVIRRQILEGVTAVIKLTMRSQDASKIPLKVFDRSRGADSVRFDEYAELEPSIAAQVVIREKAKMVPVVQPQQRPYGQAPQQYGVQLPYQQPAQAQAAPAPAPNMANILGQVDNATLQKLLASMAPKPQQAPAPTPAPIPQPAAPQANSQVDLASLLGMLSKQAQPAQAAPQQLHYAQPPQQQLNGQQNGQAQYAASQQLSAMLQSATAAKQPQAAQSQGAQPDVNNILAQLQRFRQ